MTHEPPVRVALRFERSSLAPVVLRSAVQFQASQAGLDDQTGANFAKASENVCRETLSKLTDSDGQVEVTMDTFHDRIELAIRCEGQQMPTIGLESFAFAGPLGKGPAGLNGMELLSCVDRVLYGTEQGAARMTLVKYLQPKR